MKSLLITKLRDKNTPRADFRAASYHLGSTLAHITMSRFRKRDITIQTPLGEASGVSFDKPLMLVPILRAGLVLLHPFLDLFPEAKVGIIGLKRNETTAIADQYYENFPTISSEDHIVVLDPMLATGGSAIKSINCLLDKGADIEKIKMVCMIAASDGVKRFKSQFPEVDLILAQEDPTLTDEKFIFPGLGDFGDRFFGTD